MPKPIAEYKKLKIHYPHKRILWSDDPNNITHVISHEDIITRYPAAAYDKEVYDYAQSEMLNDELDFIRENVGTTPGDIVCIGIVNTWSGTFMGLKTLNDNDIGKCFMSENPPGYTTWGIDTYGNLICIDSHHDGTNYLIYRAYKPSLSDRQIDNFEALVCSGKLTNRDLSIYTESLERYMCNI